ncbi:MAG: transporter substrate-binding domain-containing protein [Proteobacteria bacterium]|nr:transporter substrate-binding domain-containing protein [Pseudomonadota bacterium]
MKTRAASFPLSIFFLIVFAVSALAADLPEIKQRGVLRHLGIPYANFVSGSGDGMDVELMQKFAASIGVKYEYIMTDWGTVIQDLIGKKVKVTGAEVEFLEEVPIKGDLIANGFTILPWREKVVTFSKDTFPSQVWLIARADSKIKPIKPTGDVQKDIANTKALMKGVSVLTLKKTCLDPTLYKLSETGANVIDTKGKLNEMAPALLNKVGELTILDVPDALVALEKWPGKLKIIGPVSDKQFMAVGFPKESNRLREAFNTFLDKSRKDGSYMKIVKKYYPSAPRYFPEFFKK